VLLELVVTILFVSTEPTGVSDLRSLPSLTSLSLTWQRPNPTNGRISGYAVSYSVNGRDTIEEVALNTRHTITGLDPGAVVDVTITPSTKAGAGPTTRLSRFSTLTDIRES